MTLKLIGAKLRELRKKAGLRIMDVASAVPMSPTYVCRAEKGTLVLEVPVFQKVLETLGCADSELKMLEQVANISGRVEILTEDQTPEVLALIIALRQRVEAHTLDEATAKKMHKLLAA